MKINQRIETIFSVGVALEQSGKLKNTIYVLNKSIYIMNSDHTVLLYFPLRSSEANFNQSISFKASDYDSDHFYEKDGKIIFLTKKDGYERKKICGTSVSPEKIEKLYEKYNILYIDINTKAPINFDLTNDVINLLDTNLSHIEFSGYGGKLKIVQRNIYDGTIIEIMKDKEDGFGSSKDKEIPDGFGPIGMRTNDFIALFSFQESLNFSFIRNEGFCFIESNSPKFKYSGFISLCKYDELGEITQVNNTGENHGREEQKRRDSIPKTNKPTPKSGRTKRTKKC